MDKEKVIKTLESILDADIYDNWLSVEEHQNVCDAIALLKEQEAVEPKWFIDAHHPAGAFWCGSCGERIVEKEFDFYCSKCGKRIKWEGRWVK